MLFLAFVVVIVIAIVNVMSIASDVIDWDEAMEQCGDDEDFLRELLGDLRGETDVQVAKIDETIRVSRTSVSQSCRVS